MPPDSDGIRDGDNLGVTASGRWAPHSGEIGTQSGPPDAATNPLHGVKEHPSPAEETKQLLPLSDGTTWGLIMPVACRGSRAALPPAANAVHAAANAHTPRTEATLRITTKYPPEEAMAQPRAATVPSD